MGTTEAIAGVRKAVEKLARVQETRAHSEAPVSMSAKIQSPTGVIWTLTIRDGATKEAVSAIVQLTKDVEAGMVKGGWKPYGNGAGPGGPAANGHAAASAVAAAAPAVTAGANDGSITPAPPATAPPANGKKKSPGRDFIIAQDGTPYCAIHGTPLEPSKFGGLYCPLPGGGKNGFCTARYNP